MRSWYSDGTQVNKYEDVDADVYVFTIHKHSI